MYSTIPRAMFDCIAWSPLCIHCVGCEPCCIIDSACVHVPPCCFHIPVLTCCVAAFGGEAASDTLRRHVSEDEDKCYHLYYASLDGSKAIE